MPNDRSDVGSRPVVRSWTLVDFILIWLGGFLGTAVFLAVGTVLGDDDLALLMGLAGQYAGNLGVLWLLRNRKEDRSIGFSIEPSDTAYIGVGLVAQIALALMFLPLSRFLFPDGQPPQEVADIIANSESSPALKLGLVVAAVLLAPVTEEIVFRGVLIKALAGRSKRFIILTSAAVFAGVHVFGLNLESLAASAAVVLPPIFILGVALAWLTLRTGRLGPAIFLHSGWNLLAAFVLLLPADLLEGL